MSVEVSNIVFSYFAQVICFLCTDNKIISTTAFQVSETLTRCTNECILKCLFSQNGQILNYNINLACDIHDFFNH